VRVSIQSGLSEYIKALVGEKQKSKDRSDLLTIKKVALEGGSGFGLSSLPCWPGGRRISCERVGVRDEPGHTKKVLEGLSKK